VPDATQLASGKLLLDEPAPDVVRLKISNPGKRGALDHEILDTLAETLGRLEARCVVITGDGPVFSAGYDIGNFDEDSFSDQAEKLVAHPFTEAIDAIDAYPYPVLAQINGHAIGGGLEVAVACDMRIAARRVRMGMPPAKIGLIYSHTGLHRFVEVCGLANTNELFHLGRNVETERAYEMGLVNWVVEPDELEERTVEIAGEIGANAPLSLAGNKRALRELRAASLRLDPETERELVELRASCFLSEDFREGIRSFAEKRPPRWTGR
jgi:enoyl-CoA hydratase/carnithine racemase